MEEQKEVEETKTFTQEEVNAYLEERIAKMKRHLEKENNDKYADYEELKAFKENADKKQEEIGNSLNDANSKLEESTKEIENLKSQIAKYETDSVKNGIAREFGIPFELANKISGETEEEMKADAEKLSHFINVGVGAPQRNQEAKPEIDGVTAAFLKNNPRIKL